MAMSSSAQSVKTPCVDHKKAPRGEEIAKTGEEWSRWECYLISVGIRRRVVRGFAGVRQNGDVLKLDAEVLTLQRKPETSGSSPRRTTRQSFCERVDFRANNEMVFRAAGDYRGALKLPDTSIAAVSEESHRSVDKGNQADRGVVVAPARPRRKPKRPRHGLTLHRRDVSISARLNRGIIRGR